MIKIFGVSSFILLIVTQAIAATSLEMATLTSLKQDIHWTGNAATSIAHSTLTFLVSTGGCTNGKSFRIDERTIVSTQHIRLVRIVEDRCKAHMEPIEVKIETDALKIGDFYPIIFDNPILPEGRIISTGNLVPVN